MRSTYRNAGKLNQTDHWMAEAFPCLCGTWSSERGAVLKMYQILKLSQDDRQTDRQTLYRQGRQTGRQAGIQTDRKPCKERTAIDVRFV